MGENDTNSYVAGLASFQRAVERICAQWPAFLEKRNARLEQQRRHGTAAEKVSENILEDLFTEVLDWTISDLNNQIGYADLLLSRLGIKYLLIEAKRPDALVWNRPAIEAALNQAQRYASEQKVKCIAVSDGVMLYAADVEHGGLRDRVFVDLSSMEPPQEALWWLSVHGIYRLPDRSAGATLTSLPETSSKESKDTSPSAGTLLHPKYKLPAQCFAFVGNPNNPATWKLPYLLSDGLPDTKRLPKALQAILSNYRGVKVSAVPEQDIPDVLVRLGCAAARLGKMPHQSSQPAPIYVQLNGALDQLGRLDEIVNWKGGAPKRG